MLISLIEYAEQHGKEPSGARRLAIAGELKTARKIGRNWVVEHDEPWPGDRRVKSGNYIGWRSKNGKTACNRPPHSDVSSEKGRAK